MARETARYVSIADLLAGRYTTREGWEPNFIETIRGNVSRVNILATVVTVEDAKSVIIDDGTGRMQCRSFEKDIVCHVGDVILCIGRPRQFAGSIFLLPEIMKAVADPLWIEHRKAVLAAEMPVVPAAIQDAMIDREQRHEHAPAIQHATPALFEKPAETTQPQESILDIIQRLDSGDGADIDAVIETAGANAETKVRRLIEEGHVFENRPGKVKVL